MKHSVSVQDQFLKELQEEQSFVTVQLTDATTLKGTVKTFDNFTILLESEKQHLIYKHAVCMLTVESGK